MRMPSRLLDLLVVGILMLAAVGHVPISTAEETEVAKPPETEFNDLTAQYRMLYAQERFAEAVQSAERALQLAQEVFGPESELVAHTLNSLGHLASLRHDPVRAETMHRRALAIREKLFASDGPAVTQSLNNLAKAYVAQQRYEEAIGLLRRSLDITERHVSSTDPYAIIVLTRLAEVLRTAGHTEEADEIDARVASIRSSPMGLDSKE